LASSLPSLAPTPFPPTLSLTASAISRHSHARCKEFEEEEEERVFVNEFITNLFLLFECADIPVLILGKCYHGLGF
jgi:hypothetical protein